MVEVEADEEEFVGEAEDEESTLFFFFGRLDGYGLVW